MQTCRFTFAVIVYLFLAVPVASGTVTGVVLDSTQSCSATDDASPPFAVGAVSAVAALAGVVAALSATRYGYYYDELYFIAAGKRPSFSYADQGPVLPLLAWSMDWLFSGSFAALRIPSIVAALVVVIFGAATARELSGGRGAQVLTATACSTSFYLLGQAGTLSTNSIDTALWVVLTWLLVRWVRTRRDVLLLVAGLVTAVDMQVKWLVPVFWVAVFVAVAWLGPRELLRRPALWWGAGFVVVATAPAVVWQARHGWPQLGMGAVVRGQTNGFSGSLMFVPAAAQMCGILGGVLLVYGAWRLCRSPRLRPYRFLGVAFLLVVAVFAISGGRIGYGVGAYVAMMAAGAVELTALGKRWLVFAAVPTVVLSVLAFVVLTTPWRPASELTPASNFAVAVASPVYGEFGWAELTSATVDAYRALPVDQRSAAVIVTDRYIQASALDHSRSGAGLPAVFSPHRGFGYFGTPPDTAVTVLWVGGDESKLRTLFSSVAPAAKSDVRVGIPGITTDVTIWECNGPTLPWSAMWPSLRQL